MSYGDRLAEADEYQDRQLGKGRVEQLHCDSNSPLGQMKRLVLIQHDKIKKIIHTLVVQQSLIELLSERVGDTSTHEWIDMELINLLNASNEHIRQLTAE
jgi:hypothetical protein